MTDQDILNRLMDGSLVVDLETAGVVSSYANDRDLCVIERESRGGVYRFVKICANGRQKKIALHRLVWMAYSGEVVPDGYDVHHKNGSRREPYPDALENLELLPSSDNRADNQRFRGDDDEVPF